MSRLALINKNLKRRYMHAQYAAQIAKLKQINNTAKNIAQIQNAQEKEKRTKMLFGAIKTCPILPTKYIKALLSTELEKIKFVIMLIFQKLPRDAFKNRIRKRCIISGRPRGLRNELSSMFIQRFNRDLVLYGFEKL
ncbi:MAG: hypothetical protein AAFO15_01665 [Pseudomonadota bacterium]